MKPIKTVPLVLFTLTIFACADDIDSTGQDIENSCPQTAVQEDENGIRSMTINAMDYEAWVKIHLDDGATEDENDWDLALRRFALRLNGGGSGTGYGIGQWVEGDQFDASGAPESDWSTDQSSSEELVFTEWYNYNPMTHKLTPKDRTYFVRGHDGMRYYAVVVENYYSAPPAGDSGCVSLRWRAIDAPMSMPENISGTGTLPMSQEDPHMMNMTDEETDAEDPSAGCYSGAPMHTCDCETTQSACEGTWTALCECGE